jgi:hypothetical protein
VVIDVCEECVAFIFKFFPESGGDMFLLNVANRLQDNKVSHSGGHNLRPHCQNDSSLKTIFFFFFFFFLFFFFL